MKPLDNPLKSGNLVWRGWGRRFGIVEHIGSVVAIDGRLLVPVQYRSHEYGVVEIKEVLKPNGQTTWAWRELQGKGDGNDLIRRSGGMPAVISASPEKYFVCVVADGFDVTVSLEPRRTWLGSMKYAIHVCPG